jgi:hypothetical protein
MGEQGGAQEHPTARQPETLAGGERPGAHYPAALHKPRPTKTPGTARSGKSASNIKPASVATNQVPAILRREQVGTQGKNIGLYLLIAI